MIITSVFIIIIIIIIYVFVVVSLYNIYKYLYNDIYKH